VEDEGAEVGKAGLLELELKLLLSLADSKLLPKGLAWLQLSLMMIPVQPTILTPPRTQRRWSSCSEIMYVLSKFEDGLKVR